jgi:2',3'-cyclic-nucleotide 2'-phosphodiesterase (5'-nucleotidase family)
MIHKYLIVFFIGAGLLACSSVTGIGFEAEQIAVTGANSSDNVIDSLIRPYKVKMDAKMDSTIAIADQDFTKGRPGGALNNWAADAIYNQVEQSIKDQLPKLCLLNVGGLRNPINKGNVSLGDIFKLMPFDNEVVAVKLPMSTIEEIEAYFKKSGGEPISGAMVKAGKIRFVEDYINPRFFWVITSDYLLGGGDHMDFFNKGIEIQNTGLLMRDLMLKEASEQGRLIRDNEIRISF